MSDPSLAQRAVVHNVPRPLSKCANQASETNGLLTIVTDLDQPDPDCDDHRRRRVLRRSWGSALDDRVSGGWGCSRHRLPLGIRDMVTLAVLVNPHPGSDTFVIAPGRFLGQPVFSSSLRMTAASTLDADDRALRL